MVQFAGGDQRHGNGRRCPICRDRGYGRPEAAHEIVSKRTVGKSLSESTLRRLLKRMGFSRKKDCGGAGTRRVAMSRLEGDARNRLIQSDSCS